MFPFSDGEIWGQKDKIDTMQPIRTWARIWTQVFQLHIRVTYSVPLLPVVWSPFFKHQALGVNDWALEAECKRKEMGRRSLWEDVCLGTWHRTTQDAQSGHFCVFRGQIHGVTQRPAHTFSLLSWLCNWLKSSVNDVCGRWKQITHWWFTQPLLAQHGQKLQLLDYSLSKCSKPSWDESEHPTHPQGTQCPKK